MCIYTHTDPKIQILVHTDPGACPISLFLFPFFVKSFFVHWYRNLSACLSGNSLFKKKKWTGKMIIGNIFEYCKTQNSGLRSKEEKPCDPINQSSRCNTQEGLLTIAQTGWLWSPGRQSTPTANWASFLYAKKKHTISILHTGYKVIGYMFAKQSYWYKLCGLLFKLKAILLVQTARALGQT